MEHLKRELLEIVTRELKDLIAGIHTTREYHKSVNADSKFQEKYLVEKSAKCIVETIIDEVYSSEEDE
jgi:hypothetical protein